MTGEGSIERRSSENLQLPHIARAHRLAHAMGAVLDMMEQAGIASSLPSDVDAQGVVGAIAAFVSTKSEVSSFKGVILAHNGRTFEVLELTTAPNQFNLGPELMQNGIEYRAISPSEFGDLPVHEVVHQVIGPSAIPLGRLAPVG